MTPNAQITARRHVSGVDRACMCRACGKMIAYAQPATVVTVIANRHAHTPIVCRECARTATDEQLIRGLIIEARGLALSAPRPLSTYVKDLSTSPEPVAAQNEVV